MEPWLFVTSLRPVTSISATPFTTAWSMAFRSIGPGRHLPTSETLDETVRLLLLDLEGRPAESPSVALDINEIAVSLSLSSLAVKWRALGRDHLSDPRRRSLRPCSWLCEQWWSGWISLAGLLHMESGTPVIGSLRRLGLGGCFRYSGCWLGHWRAEQTADIR